MKKAYLLTLKEVYQEPEKTVFLNEQKANDYFKNAILQAFKENETIKDDDGYTLQECLLSGSMESDPYTATLEEIKIIE